MYGELLSTTTEIITIKLVQLFLFLFFEDGSLLNSKTSLFWINFLNGVFVLADLFTWKRSTWSLRIRQIGNDVDAFQTWPPAALYNTQSVPAVYPLNSHTHTHTHTLGFMSLLTSALPVIATRPCLQRQRPDREWAHKGCVRSSVYVNVWRYFDPQMRRCTDAEPKRLCVCLLILCMIRSQPNWRGAWLHKTGTLWNTKYFMENPMKMPMLL